MPIYVSQNGQQFGPYEDHVVVEQLRAGALSADDMGIRHGEQAWRRLGDMFPDVGTGTAVQTPVGTSGDIPKKGGCLKTGLIVTGILMILIGIAAAAGSRFVPSVSCDLAERDKDQISKLERDLKKAQDEMKFDRQAQIRRELDSALSGARTSQEYCNNDRTRNNLIAGAGGLIGFLGLVLTIVGFIVGRRR